MQMTAAFLRVLVVVLALAPAVYADAPESDGLVPMPMSSPHDPEPFDDHIAIEDWDAQRHWSYGTDRLMPLTRGMEDAGIPRAARCPLYLFTVPFDLIQLPFAVIGGLYGN
ncbi:MAG: hypothetical protein QF462_08850 [Myxococcota bacterium]|jgi:hypothetical protein|nr:hypothetical protein [Myxococcota bacterium]